MESEGYNAIIGSQYAPILNALARDYGIAANYRGVGDPSEPNYVAMLGGSTFGIASDDPYWFPHHTIDVSPFAVDRRLRRGRSFHVQLHRRQ